MQRVNCIDTNGRRFHLLVEDTVVIDSAWIAKQNINRARWMNRSAIVSWFVEKV